MSKETNLPDRKRLWDAPGLHTVANLPNVWRVSDYNERSSLRQFADLTACDDFYNGNGRRALRVGDSFFTYDGEYGCSPFNV